MKQIRESRMEKKYKLTDETNEWLGRTLYRIEALRDFGDVKAGDRGGWIEKEANLSHEGSCWVFGNAGVCDRAWVFGNAEVFGKARVSGNAMVYGTALVSGNARVFDNAMVYGDALVSGNALVSGYARVPGDARVRDEYISD